MNAPAAGPWRRLTVAVGNLMFRYRNAAFPATFAIVVLFMHPRLIGSPTLDRWLTWVGCGVALLGQAIRLSTIGFEYIERGGKEGKVYASRLVQGGVYGLSRNPMYVGNGLIATGMIMLIGAPWVYAVVLPLFLFIYYAIVAAEETYLHGKFGPEYEAYCARVPRWRPAWRNRRQAFTGMRYNWRRAVRKDLGTITGLLVGIIAIPAWRVFLVHGFATAKPRLVVAAAGVAVVLGVYAVLAYCKKRRVLFYTADEFAPDDPMRARLLKSQPPRIAA